MRPRDRLLEPAPARLTGAARRPSEPGTATSLYASVLHLQRSAGNQAVASLLALQRCGGTPCGCAHDEPDQRDPQADRTSAQRQDDQPTSAVDAGGAASQPIAGADPSISYGGLEALQDQNGGQSDNSAPLQRDGPDAGGGAPRTGLTCRVFTSFAEFFRGTAPNSPYAAQTSFNFVVGDGRIAVDEDRAASWVNRGIVPVDGRRTAQTGAAVNSCRRAGPGPTTGDYTWTPSASCSASAALRQPATATTRAECDSVIGAQLDAEDLADMARLLRHEQYHLNLACAIATLGNNLLTQGTAVADVRNQVVSASQRLQAGYDAETDHGCNAGPQVTWEANIDSRGIAFP